MSDRVPATSFDNFFAFDAPAAVWFDGGRLQKSEMQGAEPAKDADEESPIRRFIAIISAAGKDFDGEDVLQKGLDWYSHFISKGWFNYEHLQGFDNVMGFPLRDRAAISEARDSEGNEATRCVGNLVMSPTDDRARRIYGNAMALQKAGTGGQVGFSVEGAVKRRDPRNHKRILEAQVRNVAFTACPKRDTARLEMVKSEAGFAALGVGAVGYQSAPQMPTDIGALSALITQSIDGGVTDGTNFRDRPRKTDLTKLCILMKARYPQWSNDEIIKGAQDLQTYMAYAK